MSTCSATRVYAIPSAISFAVSVTDSSYGDWFFLRDSKEYNEEEELQKYFRHLYHFFVQKVRYLPRRRHIGYEERKRLCTMFEDLLRVQGLLQQMRKGEVTNEFIDMNMRVR